VVGAGTVVRVVVILSPVLTTELGLVDQTELHGEAALGSSCGAGLSPRAASHPRQLR